MRKIYLLIIIVVGLFSLALYSTYAMFTANVETDNFVNLSASSLPTETQILEYERITIKAKDSKIIDFNINNNTTSNLYYGAWYEMVELTSINDNIIIAKYVDSESETFGSINASSKKKVTLIVKNDTDNNITINIGVAYSETNSLNLPTNRELITDVYTPNLDSSGANAPKLVDNMIPVMYNKKTLVKADSENSDENYKWYDYDNKQWANAVLVSSTNRTTYVNANAGTVIPESDVLAYYVWIPRYKYEVWNINKVIGADSYDAQTTGIDIVFEDGTSSTGEIKCNEYDFSIIEGNGLSETCSGTNGEYYTHPAFTFGDTEVEGIWVGKFEVSNSTSQIQTKPNVVSLRSQRVTSFYSAIKNMQKSGNVYGLSTDTNKVDSHMLKNMEWGAVAYLTHSDYGRCNGSSCEEVTINNSSSHTTGGGNYVSNVNQSSTGNIYGIYDLSGGAGEYVMGNMSFFTGTYTYDEANAGSNFSYSDETTKYIDTYAMGIYDYDQSAMNRARLGDATGEVMSTASRYGGWYNDYARFVNYEPMADIHLSWFYRGGLYSDGSNAGVFYFSSYHGNTGLDYSTRATLLAF